MSELSSLDKVLGKVLEEALAEYKKVLDLGLEESVKVLDDEKADAEKEAGIILEQGMRQAETIKTKIVGVAELDSRNEILTRTEEAVNRVFQMALDSIGSSFQGDGAVDSNLRLLEEAVRAVGTREVKVTSNREFLKVLTSSSAVLEKKFNVSMEFLEPVNCLGGVIVRSKDDTILFDNTIEARIDRMRPVLRREVGRILTR